MSRSVAAKRHLCSREWFSVWMLLSGEETCYPTPKSPSDPLDPCNPPRHYSTMAEPLSILVGGTALIGAITKTTLTLIKFTREVRDARGDVDAVSRELSSLKLLLELLVDDTAEGKKLPDTLQKQVTAIVGNCNHVLVQIDLLLNKFQGGGVRKHAMWAVNGRDDLAKLRSNLEAHKTALEIALDMIAM